MKNYKIISPYDYLAIIDNKEVFVEQGQTLEFENNTSLSIYPCKENSTAFSFNLENSQDCDFFSTSKLDDNKIFYFEDGNICKNYFISTLTIDDHECKFEIGEEKIVITYLNYKKELHLSNKFDKYQVGSMSSSAYILLTSKESQTLFIFDCKRGKINLLQGDQIKINSTNILSTKNLDNIARHTIEEEYLVTDDGLIRKTKNINYQNGRPITVTTPQVVPYAFLEALSLGDLELASSYLDLSMRRQIDNEHLKEYFGEILSFSPITTSQYLVVTRNEKRIFNFVLTENKITEIEKQD